MRSEIAAASIGALVACLLTSQTSRAWLFVEHTSVGRAAMSGNEEHQPQLPKPERDTLQQAWNALRASESPVATELAAKVAEDDTAVERKARAGECAFSAKVDLPMLAALAADHSCSERDLDATLRADWLEPLIKMFIANYEEIRIAPFGSRSRTSLWHESHLLAQGLDSQYLFRTGTSHFVASRRWQQSPGAEPNPESLQCYARRVSQRGAAINAVGVYVYYHGRALNTASEAGCKPDAKCASPESARSALLFEAVALHFLEDAFSAGHVAGGPRDTSRAARMGTHDQYCQDGLSVQTWNGDAYPAFGDAHLHKADKLWTSRAVAASLMQLAHVLAGAPTECQSGNGLDVCTDTTMDDTSDACVASMGDTLKWLPQPPLEPTPVPSFRNDIGVFFRFSAAADGGIGRATASASGGPAAGRVVPTWGVDANLGLGFTLDGVTAGWSDAVMVAEGGLTGVAGQRASWCFNCSNLDEPIDTRLGWTVRLRMPFEFVPGDFVILGAAYLVTRAPSVFTRLVDSADGGFYWRWQRVWVLGNGMGLQFVAGREAQYSGYNTARALANATGPQAGKHASYSWTFPAFDWIVMRNFAEHSGNQFKVTLSYRYEHSDLIDSHSALVSLTSDSDAYVTGL
jgi:hypothetical protein